MTEGAMELTRRYAGLIASSFILSFVLSITAARPITGSAIGASHSAMITAHVTVVDSHQKVHGPIPESTLPDVENRDHEPAVLVTDELTTVNREFEEGGVTHEKRMLAASTDDYGDPSENENPKHNP